MAKYSVLLGLSFQLALVWISWNEVQGTDFLVAVHHKVRMYIYFDPGKTGGTIQVQYPNYAYRNSRSLTGRAAILVEEGVGVSSGIEPNSILITCSHDAGKIQIIGDNFRYNVFSPLPLTALGTRYIVSSCQYYYSFIVVIATGAEHTYIDITVKGRGYIIYEGRAYHNGDILSIGLPAYYTFTCESGYDLTGTIVNSTQKIALFTGMRYSKLVVAYEQMLPVKHYSKEYVVAVDNNTALYNLQIISEDNNTLINFNNGSRAVVDGSGFYRRKLRQNEMFHFTTSNPVMTTLCKIDGQKSGFLVIPPVSLFKTQNSVRLPNSEHTALLIIPRHTEVNISSNGYTNIYNSGYKVTKLQYRYPYFFASDKLFTGAVLFFSNYSIYSYGVSGEDVTPVFPDTQGYILAVPISVGNQRDVDMRLAAIGETGGFWQVQYPSKGETYNRQAVDHTADAFTVSEETHVSRGLENKSIIINAVSKIHLYCYSSNHYDNGISFSPLPVSALGKKYIVPSCHNPYVNTSLLVVATAGEMAEVDITFRLGNQSIIYDTVTYYDGDILKITLQKYQTLTIRASSSLCGTTITADINVAVFSGTDDPISYMQILPVNLYGQEYVAALGQYQSYFQSINDSITYYVMIIGEHINTRISFENSEIVSFGQKNYYQRLLLYNESILFTTTRPVMVSVCMYHFRLNSRPRFICSILPAVSFYTHATAFAYSSRIWIKVLTGKSSDDPKIQRSIGRSWIEDIPCDWRDTPNSKYIVGTCLTPSSGSIFINSNKVFTVLGFGYSSSMPMVLTTGYRFDKSKNEPSNLTDPRHESPKLNTSISNPDVAGQRSVTVVVGIVLGLVIVILVIIISGLLIYIRRTIRSKCESDDSRREEFTSHDHSLQQESTFTSERRDAEVAVISSGRTYADLKKEDQHENIYEQVQN